MKRTSGLHRRGAVKVVLGAGFPAIFAFVAVIGASASPFETRSIGGSITEQDSFQVVPFHEVDGVRTNANVLTRAELDALILSSEPKSITLGQDFEITEVVIGPEADAARLEPGSLGNLPSFWESVLSPRATQ